MVRRHLLTRVAAAFALSALVPLRGGAGVPAGRAPRGPEPAAQRAAPADSPLPADPVPADPAAAAEEAAHADDAERTAAAAAGSGSPNLRKRWPKPASGGSASGDPEVLFTFDDGPHEKSTGPILDTLAQYGIKTVFFWTGWRVRSTRPIGDVRRALLERALREGHVIGNHTVNHAHLCALPRAQAAGEIDDNATIYQALTGMPLWLFRSPYGGRCTWLEDALAERGMFHWHWDLDPLEWQTASMAHTRDYLIDRIGRLRDGQRAVVLLHDTKWATMKALPAVLSWIQAENRRRLAAGRRPIRLISYADVVREQIPPSVRTFVADTGAALTTFVPEVLSTLVGPLAPLLPATSGTAKAPRAALAPANGPL
jgi:peptidoglycan/xylan/chitin deacetylase (PgdA/CDA1 family)